MSLEQTINESLIIALKAKDELTVSVFRLLKSALKNAAVAKQSELTVEDELKVIKQEVKKRQDSVTSFRSAGREDLAVKEEAELKILQVYLPAEMPEAELSAIVDQVILAGSFSPADFGQAMKAIMAEVKGQADGARISALVKERLNKK